MTFVASTISEQIRHEGEIVGEKRGEERGEKRGEKRGELKGALAKLKKLREEGYLREEKYQAKAAPLRRKLKKLGAR